MSVLRFIPAGLTAAFLILAGGLMPASAQDTAAAASSGTIVFDIPAQNLGEALSEFARQSGQELLYAPEAAQGRTGNAVSGQMSRGAAMERLLDGTGLEFLVTPDGGMMVGEPAAVEAYRSRIQRRNGQAVAGNDVAQVGKRRPGIEEIIVTGQKREERIQDVPIAISAFSAEDLEAQKLEGGFDLLKAIPNVTFSKTNFTSYNFQIRGVGTQSISATSDPGVAVSFNNVAIIQNRLFEQEYLDVERVEVLRGPQGTLYGRNATAGVINVISNKPELGVWDGMLDVEVGNYNTRRLRGHFNMPIGDTFAIRGAYASTDREGYTFNSGTGNNVDGRDLWTGRLSLGWQPSDRLRADFIYERFEEQDDRLRTGKQLCHRDPELDTIGDTPIHIDNPDNPFNEEFAVLRPAFFNQGCEPGSLYSDGAFDTPNGLAAPFIFGAVATGNTANCNQASIGYDPGQDKCIGLLLSQDPYGGKRQSRDLREIESVRDPDYRAEADLFELNVDFDVTEFLQFSSQTAYVEDETFSFQDFNRFNTEPVFADTSPLRTGSPGFDGEPEPPSRYADLAPGGVFCDPQIGCTDKLAGFDISQASAEQFSQEFRLQSSFAGPLNFSVGANYTEFEAVVDYYIMFNILTAEAFLWPFSAQVGHDEDVTDPTICPYNSVLAEWVTTIPGLEPETVPRDDPSSSCPYIDTNPVNVGENFEGDGHNYFRSKNPYELESTAIFGELYWNIQDDLKLTAGLRYTDDKKTFTNVPTQLLLAPSVNAGGTTPVGYPEDGKIEQQWGEWTGRLVLDWQPVLNFTDETLIYGSFSRGYKGGGANPPTPGFATAEEMLALGCDSPFGAFFCQNLPILQLTADEYDPTFEPEFVNAYEIGTKNTLFGGAMTLNATAFYYDYTDYQISQIRDRTAVNENFDAEMWGLELETIFVPSPNWQFLANIGYLKTKIGEGEKSIDIMNRTQGNPDYVLVKPWLQLPSNCVAPKNVAESYLQSQDGILGYWQVCGGLGGLLGTFPAPSDDNFEGAPYDVSNYDGTNGTADLNGGAGILADVSGNELPQSPRFTVTLGGQYSFDVTPDWRGTIRMDYYWQDESYHRIYNTEPYDRLKSWSNTNLSFWVNNANTGITVEAYVKNLFNQTPITGAFLNSDDTGLTTNVFMFDPRLIGVSVRKEW